VPRFVFLRPTVYNGTRWRTISLP